MTRRLVLVDLTWSRNKDPRLSLGHASLLASLRVSPAVDVRSIIASLNDPSFSVNIVALRIMAETSGVSSSQVDVAIGVYVWAERAALSLLRLLRKRGFRGRIILGGPQISYAGDDLPGLYPDADVFIRGYAELALAEIVAHPSRRDVRGVVYAHDRDRYEQAVPQLATLPSPWLDGPAPATAGSFIRWETQRGCPFRCAFCQHREPGARLSQRSLSAHRLIKEVDLFCASRVGEIAVLDPIFNIGHLSIEILQRFSAKRFDGRLSLQCRAELATDEFLEAASRLNVRLEFGLQTIHAREMQAIQRNNAMRRVDATLAKVRKVGLAHEVSLIFGLPGQTLDSFLASVQWCLNRRVPIIKAFPLLLLRGTGLAERQHNWELAVERGQPLPMVVASSTFGRGEWLEMARISEALSQTEGDHPADVRGLRELAASLEPDYVRWQPNPAGATVALSSSE